MQNVTFLIESNCIRCYRNCVKLVSMLAHAYDTHSIAHSALICMIVVKHQKKERLSQEERKEKRAKLSGSLLTFSVHSGSSRVWNTFGTENVKFG